jgi:hypothetical protein
MTILTGRLRGRADPWLWCLMLLGGWIAQLLTVGPPNGARGVDYVPVVINFAGVTLDGIERQLVYMAEKLPPCLHEKLRVERKVVAVPVIRDHFDHLPTVARILMILLHWLNGEARLKMPFFN